MNTFMCRCNDPVESNHTFPALKTGIFFDRDGTLIEECHYLKSIADIRFLPKVCSGLQKLKFANLPLYIFTNQAGVAHGYFDEIRLHEIHQYLFAAFERSKIHFNGLLYCPHHPTAEIPQYRLDCSCRKPYPGLLFKAAAMEGIDLTNSYVIGDKLMDISAGKQAGSKTILVLTGYGKRERSRVTSDCQPDFIAADFEQVVYWILKDLNTKRRMGVHEKIV